MVVDLTQGHVALGPFRIQVQRPAQPRDRAVRVTAPPRLQTMRQRPVLRWKERIARDRYADEGSGFVRQAFPTCSLRTLDRREGHRRVLGDGPLVEVQGLAKPGPPVLALALDPERGSTGTPATQRGQIHGPTGIHQRRQEPAHC